MTWDGGKDGAGVSQRLISSVPLHRLRISPFLGDCAVMRRMRPAPFQIGVDSDDRAIDRFQSRWCHDEPLWVFVGCGLAYLRSLFRLGWRQVGDCCESAVVGGVWFGGQCIAFRDIFVFADPPYPLDTRTGGRIYREEWDRLKHLAFLRTVRELADLGVCVMVCSYWSEMYVEELADWFRFSHNVQSRAGIRKEWVWMSYPFPDRLHDTRWLGRDRREREILKRRRDRLVARMHRLPTLEAASQVEALEESGILARYGFVRNGASGFDERSDVKD